MTKEEIALGMLALKHAMDRIAPAQRALREQAKELLGRKERIPVEIDGEIVGTIGKSAPKKDARVSDGVKLQAWMAENYPEHVETVQYVEDIDAVIPVLMAHAPELVHQRQQVAETVVRSMLADAEKFGSPVGPGGEADVPGIVVDTPDGNVSVIPDKANGYLVEQLFTSGAISLDGEVRREIEG